MGTLNISRDENMNEIVFENRNKAYGAYALRSSYNDHVIKGFFITSFMVATLVLIPTLINKFKKVEILPEKIIKEIDPRIVIYKFDLEKKVPKVETDKVPAPKKEKLPVSETLASAVVDEKTNEAKDMKPAEDPVKTSNEKSNNTASNPDPNTSLNPNAAGNGKDPATEENSKQVEDMYTVDIKPEFLGDLSKFLYKHISYPEPAREAGIFGTVHISFVIDEEGNVTDVELVRGIGGGCDEVALNAVKKMPKWKPGRNKANKPVKVQHRIPIKFTLAKG